MVHTTKPKTVKCRTSKRKTKTVRRNLTKRKNIGAMVGGDDETLQRTVKRIVEKATTQTPILRRIATFFKKSATVDVTPDSNRPPSKEVLNAIEALEALEEYENSQNETHDKTAIHRRVCGKLLQTTSDKKAVQKTKNAIHAKFCVNLPDSVSTQPSNLPSQTVSSNPNVLVVLKDSVVCGLDTLQSVLDTHRPPNVANEQLLVLITPFTINTSLVVDVCTIYLYNRSTNTFKCLLSYLIRKNTVSIQQNVRDLLTKVLSAENDNRHTAGNTLFYIYQSSSLNKLALCTSKHTILDGELPDKIGFPFTLKQMDYTCNNNQKCTYRYCWLPSISKSGKKLFPMYLTEYGEKLLFSETSDNIYPYPDPVNHSVTLPPIKSSQEYSSGSILIAIHNFIHNRGDVKHITQGMQDDKILVSVTTFTVGNVCNTICQIICFNDHGLKQTLLYSMPHMSFDDEKVYHSDDVSKNKLFVYKSTDGQYKLKTNEPLPISLEVGEKHQIRVENINYRGIQEPTDSQGKILSGIVVNHWLLPKTSEQHIVAVCLPRFGHLLYESYESVSTYQDIVISNNKANTANTANTAMYEPIGPYVQADVNKFNATPKTTNPTKSKKPTKSKNPPKANVQNTSATNKPRQADEPHTHRPEEQTARQLRRKANNILPLRPGDNPAPRPGDEPESRNSGPLPLGPPPRGPPPQGPPPPIPQQPSKPPLPSHMQQQPMPSTQDLRFLSLTKKFNKNHKKLNSKTNRDLYAIPGEIRETQNQSEISENIKLSGANEQKESGHVEELMEEPLYVGLNDMAKPGEESLYADVVVTNSDEIKDVKLIKPYQPAINAKHSKA